MRARLIVYGILIWILAAVLWTAHAASKRGATVKELREAAGTDRPAQMKGHESQR